MKAIAKYVHTNLVAANWRKPAEFYIKVFGCNRKPPERKLKGEWLDSLTSIRNAHMIGHRGLEIRRYEQINAVDFCGGH